MTENAAPCANCGARLSGPWCSACGQHAGQHLLSLREFLAEALEVFTHADSRFWRTFVPLLLRPGYLTQQFVAGRRASFLPPFRLYIVLSVLFFLVVPLTASFQQPQALTPAARAAATKLRTAATVSDSPAPAGHGWENLNCRTTADRSGLPDWLAQRATLACEKIREDHGRELGHNLLHNLGRAMLVLLPLLAALMQLLYWRQHRHYVEHLLLLLHNHACMFLAMSLLLVATRLVPSETYGGILGGAFTLYAGWYLYESMRRFYGQGWLATFFRFWALTAAYFCCAMCMLVLTTVYSAATL